MLQKGCILFSADQNRVIFSCILLDSINHILADTAVYFDVKVIRPTEVSINKEVLLWRQVLQRDRPQGNVPWSSSAAVGLVRVLLTR